jgi:hypothetical protein
MSVPSSMHAAHMGSTTLKPGFTSQLVELEVSIDMFTTAMPVPHALACIKGGLCDQTTVRMNISSLWLKQTSPTKSHSTSTN